ncbi:MAG: hypothetical protein JRN62_02835 [Nitrososphaerota archaeon]|jgi:hypothetical protein|nr:hypothetical protein [Nitrososphaerota archaeon]
MAERSVVGDRILGGSSAAWLAGAIAGSSVLRLAMFPVFVEAGLSVRAALILRYDRKEGSA